MAVRKQVGLAFAEVTQTSPAFWERLTGTLANAAYTPKGKPGGGVGSAHFEVSSIASVMLGFAAHVPSEAAVVVSCLEGLRSMRPNTLANLPNSPQEEVVPKDTTLRAYLEQEIIRWASPTLEMLDLLKDDRSMSSTWNLELSPVIPWANLNFWLESSGWHYVSFRPDRQLFDPRAPGGYHKACLSLSMLSVAGNLLADTLAQPTRVPNSAPGRADEGDEATPETKEASGTGIHEGLLFDQPALSQAAPARTGSGTLLHQQSRKQSRGLLQSDLRGFHNPKPERNRHNGAYRTDAASPPPG